GRLHEDRSLALHHRCLCDRVARHARDDLLVVAGDAPGRARRGGARRPPVKRKHQRLILLLLAIGAVLGAVLLAMWGLRNNASYFYAPEDITRSGRPAVDRAVRVGGMVRRIERLPDGVSIRFTIGDYRTNPMQ